MADIPPGAFASCPAPLPHRTEITVGHGGGGRLTQDLIDRIFRPGFSNMTERYFGLRTGAAWRLRPIPMSLAPSFFPAATSERSP